MRDRSSFSLDLSDGGIPNCRHGDGRYTVEGPYIVVWITDAHGCLGVQVPGPKLKLRWSYDGKQRRFRFAQPVPPLMRIINEAIPLTRIG